MCPFVYFLTPSMRNWCLEQARFLERCEVSVLFFVRVYQFHFQSFQDYKRSSGFNFDFDSFVQFFYKTQDFIIFSFKKLFKFSNKVFK